MGVRTENRSKLWILAAVVWLAWLAGLAVMWVFYRWRVMPAPFLPLVSLVVIQFGGGAALLAAGLYRAIRGPRRAAALGWLLVGTAPLWLWSAHFSYGAWSLYVEHAALNVPVKMAGTTVSSFADIVARYRHPHRAEGRHVILFHDSADSQDAQLAAIDRHVERMDALLGSSGEGKIHWIRGPVFDRPLGGWYFGGLAVVISPPAEVANIDRHEIAHAAIDRHADAQPPTLLVEGWAESQSGYEPGYLAMRAWKERHLREVASLRELTSDAWSGSGDWFVYVFGGPLVEYLLDEFGGPKFLALYTTCRRDTFAEDCRRVLGVDLDTLDERYWQFLEKRVGELPPQRTNPLLGAKLADGVDRDAWNEFARQLPGARGALAESLEHLAVEFRGTFKSKNSDPQPIRVSIVHDGSRRRLAVESGDEHYAVVAAPDRSFAVQRRDASEPWTLVLDYHRGNPLADYAAARSVIDSAEDDFLVGGLDDVFQRRFLDALDRGDFQVTRFARLGGDGEPAVRLDFEYTVGSEPQRTRYDESFVLLPERHWALRECEARITGQDYSATSRSRFEFDDDRLPPGVPTAADWTHESTTGSIRHHVVLTERNRPADADAFELAAFGLSPSDFPVRPGVPWYVALTTGCGVASLLAGAVVLAVARHPRRQDEKPATMGPAPSPLAPPG